jgi:CRISPR-associated endonuclease/helicase Cas3
LLSLLIFNLIGETVPLDHGYELFSAIAHFEPELHKLDTVGIHTIAGIPKKGVIQVTKNSRLRIRLPMDQVRLVYPLAGKPLRINCLFTPYRRLRGL